MTHLSMKATLAPELSDPTPGKGNTPSVSVSARADTHSACTSELLSVFVLSEEPESGAPDGRSDLNPASRGESWFFPVPREPAQV